MSTDERREAIAAIQQRMESERAHAGAAHGGDMTCQSTLGVGTTFTFTIAYTLPEEVSYA